MKNKISKAQTEIWDAKQKLYESLKDLPVGKRVDFLRKKAKQALEKYFKNKTIALQPQF